MDADRVRLSILVRRAAPEIVRALVEEAARSTSADSATAAERRELLADRIARGLPVALDAIAADDVLRSRLLASLAERASANEPVAIPPLVRAGLVAIGLRLAREHLARAVAGEPGADGVLRELDTYAAAVREAIAPYVRS
ncbi:MAG TPA: hypothetical protein VFM06_02310 [Candidatus Limnocylindria bacterium]|nr:hypothetical protein [Candidatus Limnocylindria bacterium]